MEKNWLSLQSIPITGKPVTVDDQGLWKSLLDEFGLNCRIDEPVSATITILPQADGVLFRGKILGVITLPCDRCADETMVRIDHSFDSFESLPALPLAEAEAGSDDDFLGETDAAVIRNAPHGRGVEINPAALAWEEFSLALPVKPLCRENCKGLCPTCGTNRNSGGCSCENERIDPRMAALRGLTVSKK